MHLAVPGQADQFFWKITHAPDCGYDFVSPSHPLPERGISSFLVGETSPFLWEVLLFLQGCGPARTWCAKDGAKWWSSNWRITYSRREALSQRPCGDPFSSGKSYCFYRGVAQPGHGVQKWWSSNWRSTCTLPTYLDLDLTGFGYDAGASGASRCFACDFACHQTDPGPAD